jgi:hypothetical protein
MRSIIFTIIASLSLTVAVSQSRSQMGVLTVPIDKGSLYGNKGVWSIEFIDKNITLNSGERFSLSNLGIQSSSNYSPIGFNLEKDLKKMKKWEDGFPVYRIKVDYKNEEYFGIITFFNAHPKKTNESVCKSYEIGLSDKSFTAAKSGGIGRNYEYYLTKYSPSTVEWALGIWNPILLPILLTAKAKQPTYIICISKSEDIFDAVNPRLIER